MFDTRARLRRAMLAADTSTAGAGPQSKAETVAALEALDGDTQADDQSANDPDDGEDEALDGAEELGDKGKQALDRMKERLRAERTKRLAAEQALADKDGTDQAKRLERSALAKANERILRAEVKAAAAGKLHHPEDSLRFLDLSAFDVDDDGQVDADAIDDAINDLLAKRPDLAAQGGPRSPQLDPAQGGTGRGPAKGRDRFASQFANF